MRGIRWLSINVFLLAMLILGIILLLLNFPSSPPIEIVLPTPSQKQLREVYIGGEVAFPGIYPYRAGEGIDELIQAAGGILPDASDRFKLYIPKEGEETSPQKVNINTAEEWLLEALPGIGSKLAQAIIDYRTKNGPFRSTAEITSVPGISPQLYERIKDLITVG